MPELDKRNNYKTGLNPTVDWPRGAPETAKLTQDAVVSRPLRPRCVLPEASSHASICLLYFDFLWALQFILRQSPTAGHLVSQTSEN